MLLKTFLEKTAFLTENPAATVNLKPLLRGCTLFWSDAQAIDFARVGADQFFVITPTPKDESTANYGAIPTDDTHMTRT